MPVCNPYAQINLLSVKEKTDRKSRTATAQFSLASPKTVEFKELPAAAERQLSTLTKRAAGPELRVYSAF